MILLVHLLFGAAIGSLVKSVPLAIFLAFLSHYFLDFFPHIEYTVIAIRIKQWRDAWREIINISLDVFGGLLLIYLFSKNQPITYLCAFFAILPDGLAILNNYLSNKLLQLHSKFHVEKVHFLQHKKISIFWRIFSQVLSVAVSIAILKI